MEIPLKLIGSSMAGGGCHAMASGSNDAVSGGMYYDADALDSLLFGDTVDDEGLLDSEKGHSGSC